MNVPPVLECGSIESEIVWHLTQLKKQLLKKGSLPEEYIGVLLSKIMVSWWQSKQGKGKSKAEQDQSLNCWTKETYYQPWQEYVTRAIRVNNN
jgi:hypothetical protein